MAKNFIAVCLGFSLLIVAFSIGYYFVYYLPHKDRVAAEEVKQKQQALADNKSRRADCLTVAESLYSDSWAKACTNYAKDQQEELNNCLDRPYADAALCRSMYKVDSSPECTLSKTYHEPLNKTLADMKSECDKNFPIQ